MKIAYDAKRFFQNGSGLGNYARDLVRILSHFYPANHYLLFNRKRSERGADILQKTNVEFVKTEGGLLARQLQMGKDAQRKGADIFHGLSGELPLRWSDKRIKKVVTIHDLIFERYPQYYSFFDRKIHFWKFKRAARMADIVIAISEQTKRDVMDFLHIEEEKIRVVYQGCHQAFKQSPDEDTLKKIREKYALPEKFILNVGTIEERKNLLRVAQALRGTDIPLVVVGKKTDYFKKVEQEISLNGQKARFLEGVSMEELAGIYRLATIFIYPSLFEGFGIPVIEALFSQTVVITSNTSCLPEAGGEHSVYVDPLSVEDMREKIIRLWNDEDERLHRAEQGLAFVQKFNDEHIARNLMRVYEEVLGGQEG